MPLILAGLAGVGFGLFFGGQLDDALEGAPSPFTLGGIAVWGLAGFGAFVLVKRFT